MLNTSLFQPFRFENLVLRKKSFFLCLALGLGVGFLGIHRFYGGDKKEGYVFLFLSLSVIGLPAAILCAWLDAGLLIAARFKQNKTQK